MEVVVAFPLSIIIREGIFTTTDSSLFQESTTLLTKNILSIGCLAVSFLKSYFIPSSKISFINK